MRRRMPLLAVQKAVVSLLGEYQTTAVYARPEEGAARPYICFGSFTAKAAGTKNVDLTNVSLELHVFGSSGYEGPNEINEIADDITAVITEAPIDCSEDHFKVLSQDIDMFEAFPSEDGTEHGVLTVVATVQNIGNGGNNQ